MKWELIRIGDEVSVYVEDDILPHRHDSNCPCRPSVIFLHKGQSIRLELGEENAEKLTADREITVIIHSPNVLRLEESTN